MGFAFNFNNLELSAHKNILHLVWLNLANWPSSSTGKVNNK